MPDELAVSFPHMGDYSVVFTQLLGHLLPNARVFPAPPITRRTVELGSRHSPDFICAPFKYNLGNYIEALDRGANVLFQTGLGCRYGYYGELQEQILRDLGYTFRFVCLSRERAKPAAAYASLQELGCALPLPKVLHALVLAEESIRAMDRFDYFMRENLAFEEVTGSLDRVRRQLLEGIARVHTLGELRAVRAVCRAELKKVEIHRPERPLRVGMVGELYTLMEPFSNFYVEKKLAGYGIAVSRRMSVEFLLFGQNHRRALHESSPYLHHLVGANGVDSVSQSLDYARKNYDGIIHLKSFGCIPELNATPALLNLARDRDIPILQLSMDSQTSETGLETRLEAFSDMIRMKKEAKWDAGDSFGGGRRFGIHQRRRA